MIVDHLDNAERYLPLNPHFASAFRFLRRQKASQLEAGRHEIDGESVYALLNVASGRGHVPPVEAHRRYIDIHFTLEGTDEIGWKPLGECLQRQTDFDAESDCEFFSDVPEVWVSLPVGCFAIVFPEDAHAPMAGQGNVRKFVMKVVVD